MPRHKCRIIPYVLSIICDECVRELFYKGRRSSCTPKHHVRGISRCKNTAGAAAAAVTRQKCHELDIIVRNKHNIMYGKKMEKKKTKWHRDAF